MDFNTKYTLITGGSRGIGRALVSELNDRGAKNIAVMGRNVEKIEELEKAFPGINFLKIKGDVSKPQDIHSAMAAVNEHWGQLDILINNAGVVSAGSLEDISDDDIANQININFTGLVLLTKHALPLLKQSRDGAIMNVSSGLGLIGMPFYSVYAGTKAAIRQFSDAMRRELKPYSIHVMTLYPTATDTDMMESTSVNNMDSPELVARKGIEGLINKDINVIFGGPQRLEDHRQNFEAPLEFDKKVDKNYEALKERSNNHRAM